MEGQRDSCSDGYGSTPTEGHDREPVFGPPAKPELLLPELGPGKRESRKRRCF